jgi:Na+/melibiose symporter-like transporter
LQLIILFIFAIITAAIASSKGRTPVGWFFIGFFTGLIGLILVLCMSNLTDEQAKQAHMLNEQRRLREQLKQERMRNQAFQQYTNNRLDVHDQSLQVDTRSADATRAIEYDEETPETDPYGQT